MDKVFRSFGNAVGIHVLFLWSMQRAIKTPTQLAHVVMALHHRVSKSPGQENQQQTPPLWGKYILLRSNLETARQRQTHLHAPQQVPCSESVPFTGTHHVTPVTRQNQFISNQFITQCLSLQSECFCQRLASELPVLSWCQSTQCCPGVRFFKGMMASPSSVFSQNAPSPSTRRWIDLWLRSPRGIPSYTSYGVEKQTSDISILQPNWSQQKIYTFNFTIISTLQEDLLYFIY